MHILSALNNGAEKLSSILYSKSWNPHTREDSLQDFQRKDCTQSSNKILQYSICNLQVATISRKPSETRGRINIFLVGLFLMDIQRRILKLKATKS